VKETPLKRVSLIQLYEVDVLRSGLKLILKVTNLFAFQLTEYPVKEAYLIKVFPPPSP
jgi:hypothetical protein